MYDAKADLIETMTAYLSQGRGLVIRSHHFSAAYMNPATDRTLDLEKYLAQEFRMVSDELKLGKTTDFFVVAQDFSWVGHYKLSLFKKDGVSQYQLARV